MLAGCSLGKVGPEDNSVYRRPEWPDGPLNEFHESIMHQMAEVHEYIDDTSARHMIRR